MQSDKRRYVRQPCSDKFFIERPAKNRDCACPIYLRDVSEGGISGTYFGEDIPNREEILYVKDSLGNMKPVRLVWAVRSVESIYMLGFKYEEEISVAC